MPLIPIPPIPMKCTCRVLPNTVRFRPGSSSTFRSAGSNAAPAPAFSRSVRLQPDRCHQLHRPVHDHARGVGPRKRTGGCSHPLASRPVPGEAHNPLRQHGAGQVALQQQIRRAACHERLGVLPLVIVGRRRQRNQNRRLPGRRDLGQRRRAGTADDYVRLSELSTHVVEERLDVGRQPRLCVGGAHHLHISLSRLMGDTQMRTLGRQLRRCLHHGHVDRVCALRAAKN